MELVVEAQRLVDEAKDGRKVRAARCTREAGGGGEGRPVRRTDECGFSGVEGQDEHGAPGRGAPTDDLVERLGVTPGVPLAARAGVPCRGNRAAHEHNGTDEGGELGVEPKCCGDVRRWRAANDRHPPWVGTNFGNDARCSRVRSTSCWHGERHRWRGKHGVAQAGRAVRLWRCDERLHERFTRARNHLYPCCTCDVENAARVAHNRLEARVAWRAGCDEQARIGRCDGIEQRHRIVDARVDIEDQEARIHGGSETLDAAGGAVGGDESAQAVDRRVDHAID